MANKFIMKKPTISLKKFMKDFAYPFSFMKGGSYHHATSSYDLNLIALTMFDSNFKSEEIDLSDVEIPRDILKVYWYKAGVNDELPWYFLGKIKYKDTHRYVFYIGECDYTGFDCQGYMKLYISKHFSRILSLAVTGVLYSEMHDVLTYASKTNK